MGRSFLIEKISTKALYDFDEARYAEVAKNIVKTGDWLIPMAGGPDEPRDLPIYTLPSGELLYPYFWKPPLSTQLMAVSMKLLGINELAVRLPSLLATLISTWLVFKITAGFFPKFKYTPYIATGLFAISSDLSFLSSQGLVEMPMLTMALAAILLATKKNYQSIVISGIFFGLVF